MKPETKQEIKKQVKIIYAAMRDYEKYSRFGSGYWQLMGQAHEKAKKAMRTIDRLLY